MLKLISLSFSEGIILGLGNPLLDITANVDNEFLNKYDMKPNNAILADKKHENLSKEMVEKYQVEYTAGGAVQNTMRCVQWVLGNPNRVTFMGGVGNDDFGKLMEQKAKEAGVNVSYMLDPTTPTGTCAVLLTDNGVHRSLCAFLGASQTFQNSHILSNYGLVEKAKFFYVSGFLLVVSLEAALELANHAHAQTGKLFCMNLSAPYISQVFSKPLLEVFPFVDILFGNETEAEAFASMKGWKVNLFLKHFYDLLTSLFFVLHYY